MPSHKVEHRWSNPSWISLSCCWFTQSASGVCIAFLVSSLILTSGRCRPSNPINITSCTPPPSAKLSLPTASRSEVLPRDVRYTRGSLLLIGTCCRLAGRRVLNEDSFLKLHSSLLKLLLILQTDSHVTQLFSFTSFLSCYFILIIRSYQF
jgi:hypothetical protein